MESLLNELLQKVSEVNSINSLDTPINLIELKSHFSSILYKYNINYKTDNIEDADISYYINMFLSIKKLEGLSDITLDTYKLELNIFNKNINKSLPAITSNDIRLYLSKFPKLKQSSIGKKIYVLKSFFKIMVREEVIIKNPMNKINAPKKEKRLPKALSEEQVETLRENCTTLREKAIFELFIATGCRLNELSQLNINDINWKYQSIKVIGKGNSERIVYFNFKATHYLKKYLNNRNDNCEALFVTERKEYRRLSNRGIQRIFNNLGDKANIKLHVHKCRHTFASNLLNSGADLALVQAMLGHSSPDTTQVYCQLSEQSKYDGYRRYAS
jgi:integrase/recombinase XerD